MDNMVLKSFTAENFTSFADKMIFTCQADRTKKEFLENTFTVGDEVYNKVSFVYGANGAGKTFFCKIVREIQRLIAWSPLTTAANDTKLLSLPQFEEMRKPVAKFAFDVAYKDKPTLLGIDIIIDKTTFHYEFAVNGKKIVWELLTKKYKRTEKLLVRTSPSYQDITLRSELKSFEKNKQVVKEEALCLPMAAFLNNDLANQIIESISGINVLNMTAPRVSPSESNESFSDERMEVYTKVLQKLDPTLRKMTVSLEEEETKLEKIELDDFENREIIQTQKTVGIQTEHAVYENGMETSSTPIDFFRDESLGTVKLFTALPHLYDVLEEGGVLILDEIENGLHPSVVKDIIQLFMDDESNPRNAQLICTSHQPLFVSDNIRRDQVWISSKDEFGKSYLQRMSSISTSRSKINLTNKLLEGALGCNPEKIF